MEVRSYLKQRKTEAWNGTSWTEVADMAQEEELLPLQEQLQQALLRRRWLPNPVCAVTEEWTTPVTAAILTEGSIFLSGGTTLKGFGKAGWDT